MSPPSSPFTDSLVTPDIAQADAARRTKPAREPFTTTLRRLTSPLLARLRPLWDRPALRYSTLSILTLALAITAYLIFRPTPQPDFAEDPMDDVLNYALLEEDFNKLPLDQRLDLIKDLVDRIRTMSADDSALMAMFAAGIQDKMRDQLMKNASLLAIDMWDKYALDYDTTPETNRDQYLDDMFLEFTKTMESVAGVQRNKTDEQRLSEAREQARKDQAEMRSGSGPGGGDLARMATFLRGDMGRHAAPQQQARAQQLMRDLTRHLRGNDVTTGKPAGGGG